VVFHVEEHGATADVHTEVMTSGVGKTESIAGYLACVLNTQFPKKDYYGLDMKKPPKGLVC
jgi:hypothetical protein